MINYKTFFLQFGIALVFGLSSCSISHDKFYRFQQEAKSELHPQEIQQWATTIIQKHDITKSDYKIPLKDIPSSIRFIEENEPEAAWVSENSDSGKHEVTIIWGGGFKHWGLIAGEKDLEVSSDETTSVTLWIKGVYFFESQ